MMAIQEKIKYEPSDFLSSKLPGSVVVPEYCVLFKRRNADTLKREECIESINNIMPGGAIVDYKDPKVNSAITLYSYIDSLLLFSGMCVF